MYFRSANALSRAVIITSRKRICSSTLPFRTFPAMSLCAIDPTSPFPIAGRWLPLISSWLPGEPSYAPVSNEIRALMQAIF